MYTQIGSAKFRFSQERKDFMLLVSMAKGKLRKVGYQYGTWHVGLL